MTSISHSILSGSVRQTDRTEISPIRVHVSVSLCVSLCVLAIFYWSIIKLVVTCVQATLAGPLPPSLP